ncbi:MAG: carboxypeptidase-like regulatory domain-containing protein [Terriglobia bacterium]
MRFAHRSRNCLAGLTGAFLIVTAPSLMAQARGELTGTVTGPDGAPVALALVTAAGTESGYRLGAATGTDGSYKFSLPSGDYRVTFESLGYKAVEFPMANVRPLSTLIENCEFGDAEQTQNDTSAEPTQQTAPTSSSKPQEPSLEDLGIAPPQAKGNAREQALLDKRSHMLKVHQRFGLITIAPLGATLITSAFAGGRETSRASRDAHAALGATTVGLYFTTAYFAIRAPKIPGTKTRGPIRLHKAMAWIHGPGMVLTPILGEIAFAQKSRGERVHGIASLHGPVAIVTAGAFGTAVMSVSFKF